MLYLKLKSSIQKIITNKAIQYIPLFVIFVLFVFNINIIYNGLSNLNPTVLARNNLSVVFNSLFSTTIFLSFYLSLKKQINIYSFTAILVFGYLSGYFELFDNLHHFLVSTNIHPLSLVIDKSLNVQSTKTLFSIIGILLLFLSFCKSRTFDKYFYTLIISVVLITTYLFHYITAHILVVQDKNLLANMVNIVIKDNKIDEQIMTNFGVSVFKKEINKNLSTIIKITGDVNEIPNSLVVNVKTIEKFFKDDTYIYHNLFFNNEPNIGNYLLLAKKSENTVYYYLLTDKMNLLFLRDEIIFFILSSIAQSIWIFGGFVLFLTHKNRIKRKALEQISKA